MDKSDSNAGSSDVCVGIWMLDLESTSTKLGAIWPTIGTAAASCTKASGALKARARPLFVLCILVERVNSQSYGLMWLLFGLRRVGGTGNS